MPNASQRQRCEEMQVETASMHAEHQGCVNQYCDCRQRQADASGRRGQTGNRQRENDGRDQVIGDREQA